jgi:enoyl-CoA hydratase/carnithine racemase
MSETTNGEIYTTKKGDVGWLTIANPQNRNAMNLSMYKMVPSAIHELVTSGIRVIIVKGEGDEAFGAGSDISEFAALRQKENSHIFDKAELEAHEAIERANVPTIAMIHGACRGGGLAIALACDLRYASEDASFAAPPAKLGIAFPHAALESLVATVGAAHANYLLLTASTIGSDEAYRIGLVHGVSDKSQLEQAVNSIADKICGLAPQSLSAAKTSLAYIAGKATTEDVESATDGCYNSNDYQEGIAAFLEKRAPNFDGT